MSFPTKIGLITCSSIDFALMKICKLHFCDTYSPNCKRINLAWNISILIGVWLWISCSSCNVQLLVSGDLDYFLGLATYGWFKRKYVMFYFIFYYIILISLIFLISSWQKKRFYNIKVLCSRIWGTLSALWQILVKYLCWTE